MGGIEWLAQCICTDRMPCTCFQNTHKIPHTVGSAIVLVFKTTCYDTTDH